jgi:hypothetical protein
LNHIIISRASFEDKELLRKYLKITREVLVPGIKSQVNKNFTWAMLIKKEDINFVRDYLEIDFLHFTSNKDFFSYVKEKNINIQTRHDLDDFMSKDYVQIIQETYLKNIDRYDQFLIQAQPVLLDYLTGLEVEMKPYTEKRTSMFLSLCQKNAAHHIHECNHTRMNEIVPQVITLPQGYTKWVIHGENISCKIEPLMRNIQHILSKDGHKTETGGKKTDKLPHYYP